jgi:hypothetical protein
MSNETKIIQDGVEQERDVAMGDLLDNLAEAEFKIKQLNRVVAVTAGRLDVVDQYIEKAEANGRPVDYEFKYFVTKSRKNVDEMLERLSNNEPVIE